MSANVLPLASAGPVVYCIGGAVQTVKLDKPCLSGKVLTLQDQDGSVLARVLWDGYRGPPVGDWTLLFDRVLTAIGFLTADNLTWQQQLFGVYDCLYDRLGFGGMQFLDLADVAADLKRSKSAVARDIDCLVGLSIVNRAKTKHGDAYRLNPDVPRMLDLVVEVLGKVAQEGSSA
jgi:hypothetical protein